MSARTFPTIVPYVEYDEVEAACSECGRYFRTQEALEAHIRESHAAETSPAELPSKSTTRARKP